MDSPPTSRIGFLDTDGNVIAAPLEWRQAFVEVRASLDDWRSIQLAVQGASLPVRIEHRFGSDRLLAEWERAGTGNYKVKLKIGDYSEQRVITINPQRISRSAYSTMIDDLQRRLPTSIAIRLQKAGALSGIHLLSPQASTLAQELLRLRRAVDGVDGGRPGLAAVLRELAQNHHVMFRSDERWVDRRAVRRPSTNGLARALVRGRNLTDAGELIQVLDSRTQHTVDVFENRLVKLFAHQVRSRLHVACSHARRRQDETLVKEAEELSTRFERARRFSSFLDEVSLPASQPLYLSMVLMRRDPYPAALEGFLEFSRGMAVELNNDALNAPLENLPSLYQTWGTLEILDVLIEVAVNLGFELQHQRLFERRRGEIVIRLLPDGKPVAELVRRSDGILLKFTPECTIGTEGRYRSESFPQRPDIVIEVTDGDSSQLFIFDPKYKLDSELTIEGEFVGRPKKVDIDKMHAYRDAIRDAMEARVVSFAAILYPGLMQKFGKGVAALKALPGEGAEMRANVKAILSTALGR